jgi:methylated-DNA-[protein]-cysteine S-methyltransferase
MRQATNEDIRYTWVRSPIGRLLLAADESALRYLLFADGRHNVQPAAGWREDGSRLREAGSQLEAYFAGELRRFSLRVAPSGTPFQMRVWDGLTEIPYGETISYGELARRVGNPKASRAVGLANKANPISIIIPCHRVIGSDGRLTGYGGGLEKKRWLLALEQRRKGEKGVGTDFANGPL